MNEKFSNVAIDLITNEDVNAGKTNGRRYSDNMRQFAVSLHYNSPKVYRWVTKISLRNLQPRST